LGSLGTARLVDTPLARPMKKEYVLGRSMKTSTLATIKIIIMPHDRQIDPEMGQMAHKRPAFTRSLHPNIPLSTIAKNRLENVVICLTMATNTLEIIVDNIETPFLGAIINTIHAVVENIQVRFLIKLLGCCKGNLKFGVEARKLVGESEEFNMQY
jgi:hypothetical protein